MSTNYKALTRAYRPQTFEDIVSQEHVSNTLLNAIAKNRLSHAYLFCGPRGVGKTTMARVLARNINEVDQDVDGEELNNTLNIIEIDAASNNSVEDIRSLRERVRIPPQNGRYKVYIIDEIHMLSKQAFNALLKTLEEPPEHVIFIFATTEPHRILPTILSRCQRFDFRRITVDEIVNRLEEIANKEGIGIDRESLHVIAKKADGALRDALGILDQAIAFCGTSITYDDLHRALNIVSSERMFELTDALIRKDAGAGMALLHNLLHIGNDIQEFLGALTEHFRNLYLARDSQNFYLIEATDETKKRFREMADSFSDDDLMRMMYITQESQFSIRNAQQPRIHLEITLLKLFHMTRSDGLKELLTRLDALEQRLSSHGTTASSAKPELSSHSASNTEQPSTTASGKSPVTSAEKPASQTAKSSTQASKAAATTSINAESDSKSTATASKTSAPASKSDNDNGPDLMGSPTLQRSRNHLSAVAIPDKSSDSNSVSDVRGNLALSPRPKPAVETGLSAREVAYPKGSELKKVTNIKQIYDIWPSYLGKLQDTVSNMIFFTVQRTRPIELNDDEITLECNDSFTSDIILEQQRRLCDTLREHFGYAVRFTTRLVEVEKRTDTVHDPYEHFSKLQKKDPKLKQIVELFGAELEY